MIEQRPDVQPEKRTKLTKLQFARLAVAQNGLCGKCGVKLVFKPHQIRDEHIVSLYGGGGNELSNRELWCVPCTKPKDKADAGKHAKIRRLRGETGQQARRKRNGSKWGKGQKLQSRGFDTTRSRKFDGAVVERYDP